MDLETLSNRILDGEFNFGFAHDDNYFSDEEDSLTHYGIKGMKWGVRKDRTSVFTKAKDRRYKDETDKEYQSRMNREFQERAAKARAKEQAASEKRAAKERLQMQKMILKSQERQQKMQMKSQQQQRKEQVKAQEKQREAQDKKQMEQAKLAEKEAQRLAKEAAKKTSKKEYKNVKSMTDQEIRDGIARYKLEQDYKRNQKAAKSVTDGMIKKTLVGAAAVGGGVLLAVGKQVATKQLSDVGNQKAEEYLIKKGLKKKKEDSGGGGSVSAKTVESMINDALKAYKEAK